MGFVTHAVSTTQVKPFEEVLPTLFVAVNDLDLVATSICLMRMVREKSSNSRPPAVIAGLTIIVLIGVPSVASSVMIFTRLVKALDV
jgi:hypothetical protein